MKQIDITVLRPGAALAAFAKTWRAADGGGEVTAQLAFDSLRALFSAITERRLELLRHVAARKPANVRQLARALGRDYKNVHTDVAQLLELGLLERDEGGTLHAPFDEIVIHAGIRDAA